MGPFAPMDPQTSARDQDEPDYDGSTLDLPLLDLPFMTNRRWTFVCVSEDERPVQQFSVSAGVLPFVPSVVAAVITALTALVMIVAFDGSARLQVAKLTGETAAISREIESIRVRVAQMEGSLDGFIETDHQFRLVAGLNPIDAEIFEVGVGGPGMTTP